MFRFPHLHWLLFDRGLDYVEFISKQSKKPLLDVECKFIVQCNDFQSRASEVLRVFKIILLAHQQHKIWTIVKGSCNSEDWNKEVTIQFSVEVKDEFIFLQIDANYWKIHLMHGESECITTNGTRVNLQTLCDNPIR